MTSQQEDYIKFIYTMRSKIINISLPEQLLQEAEAVQKEEGMSRSELFRASLRTYLSRKRRVKSSSTERLAEFGGAFDFLRDEPDLYRKEDLKPQ